MCTTFWLEVCYFYISQIESSSDKIFYKVVYHHIIYICGEFRRFFFVMVCMDFHEACDFHQIPTGELVEFCHNEAKDSTKNNSP
jgi:hypothetical protein